MTQHRKAKPWIEELEDLERQYQDHRVDGTGFDDMFTRVAMHKRLHTNVSQHIALGGPRQ